MSFEACRPQRLTREQATKPQTDAGQLDDEATTETWQQTIGSDNRRSDSRREGATAQGTTADARERQQHRGSTTDFAVGERQQELTSDLG